MLQFFFFASVPILITSIWHSPILLSRRVLLSFGKISWKSRTLTTKNIPFRAHLSPRSLQSFSVRHGIPQQHPLDADLRLKYSIPNTFEFTQRQLRSQSHSWVDNAASLTVFLVKPLYSTLLYSNSSSSSSTSSSSSKKNWASARVISWMSVMLRRHSWPQLCWWATKLQSVSIDCDTHQSVLGKIDRGLVRKIMMIVCRWQSDHAMKAVLILSRFKCIYACTERKYSYILLNLYLNLNLFFILYQ